MAGQKPVAKFKAGQISAALWENEITTNGHAVTVVKTTIQRRYKDKMYVVSTHILSISVECNDFGQAARRNRAKSLAVSEKCWSTVVKWIT